MTLRSPIPDSSGGFDIIGADFSAVIKAKRSDVKLPEDLAERGRCLQAACRGAAALERSRLAAGLPPSDPAPWPASTWEFLAEQAQSHAG